MRASPFKGEDCGSSPQKTAKTHSALCLEIKFFLIFYKKYDIIYIENMKGIKKMFDDFTTEIQYGDFV